MESDTGSDDMMTWCVESTGTGTGTDDTMESATGGEDDMKT